MLRWIGFALFVACTASSPLWGQDIRQPARPAQPQPGQPQPGQVQPGQVQPGQVQPGQVQPGQVQPGQVQPGQVQPGQVRMPPEAFVRALQPSWVPLPAAHQTLVKQILNYWEQRSNKIKTYECAFQRWKYDPVFVPPDPETGKMRPQEYSKGVIKYAMPDKALYKDTETQVYDPSSSSGWKKLGDSDGHHWICDGTSIIEFVATNKQVVKTELPQHLRGEALRTQGPLPFLFGAKTNDILQRYWVRVVTPEGVTDQYHLEAWPKQQADAANFKLVKIILDRQKYLPINLIVYNANWAPNNPAYTSYAFDGRKENPFGLGNLNPWKKEFFEPVIPKDWQLVQQQVGGPPPPPQGTAQRPGPPNPSR